MIPPSPSGFAAASLDYPEKLLAGSEVLTEIRGQYSSGVFFEDFFHQPSVNPSESTVTLFKSAKWSFLQGK
jgi:hypothetical protein